MLGGLCCAGDDEDGGGGGEVLLEGRAPNIFAKGLFIVVVVVELLVVIVGVALIFGVKLVAPGGFVYRGGSIPKIVCSSPNISLKLLSG